MTGRLLDIAVMAEAGVLPSVCLGALEPRVSVASIARTVGCSYNTAWKIANLKDRATGPKSRAVQLEIDRVLGITFPWEQKEGG